MSGWRAAVVALAVGAVVLVAGMVAPDLISEAEDGGEAGTGQVVLACTPVLEAPCREIAQRLDVAWERWSPGDPPPERGVVLAPLRDLDDPEATLVARSPVVIGAWRERAQVLAAACGGVDLACLGEVLGRRWEEVGGSGAWGEVKLGLADPTLSEPGMAAWSALAGAVEDQQIASSLRLVAPDEGRLTADLVAFGDSRADLVVATEAAVASQMENAIGRGGRLEVFYPERSPWVSYGAVGRGRSSGGVMDFLTSAEGQAVLAAFGFRPVAGEHPLPEGLAAPGEESAYPDDAARATLIDRWNDL